MGRVHGIQKGLNTLIAPSIENTRIFPIFFSRLCQNQSTKMSTHMVQWKRAILNMEKASGTRHLRMRRQFNRALRGGSDSESDEEDYVYSEEEEEEDTRTPIEIMREEKRRRYREEKEEDERRDRMRKRGPLMERMRKREKVTNALWTISNNHYNWKEGRPLWTKGGSDKRLR